MQKLELPDFDTEDILKTCISGRQNPPKRKQLIDTIPLLLGAERSYARKAKRKDLCTLARTDTAPVDGSEYVSLYKNHMARKYARARSVYDELILLARGGICPFCGHRDASTLDHYLPKSAENGFPEFALIPCNLIPACKDCNKEKSDDVITDRDRQFLHPYYDDIEKERWLYAEINYSISGMPTFIFSANPDDDIEGVLRGRIIHHFERLNIGTLYSKQAGVELSNITGQINRVFDAGGAEAVLAHLSDIAVSREEANLNSWQTAFYHACAEDDVFCSMEWNI